MFCIMPDSEGKTFLFALKDKVAYLIELMECLIILTRVTIRIKLMLLTFTLEPLTPKDIFTKILLRVLYKISTII